MNRFLHFRVEILNSHAQAIEAEASEGLEVFARSYSRINLDSNLGAGGKRKPGAHGRKQIFNLLGSQIGGGAAAPMKLNDLAPLRNAAANAIQFLFQNTEIRGSYALIFLNDHV